MTMYRERELISRVLVGLGSGLGSYDVISGCHRSVELEGVYHCGEGHAVHLACTAHAQTTHAAGTLNDQTPSGATGSPKL